VLGSERENVGGRCPASAPEQPSAAAALPAGDQERATVDDSCLRRGPCAPAPPAPKDPPPPPPPVTGGNPSSPSAPGWPSAPAAPPEATPAPRPPPTTSRRDARSGSHRYRRTPVRSGWDSVSRLVVTCVGSNHGSNRRATPHRTSLWSLPTTRRRPHPGDGWGLATSQDR
jgi:hypothetical protein